MKYLLIILLFATAACSSTPKKTEFKGNYKVLSIDTTEQTVFDTINFGRVGEGEVLVGEFLVKNESQKPLVIGNILTGCGCTTASYDKKPIAPLEERKIEFQFNTGGKQGFQFFGIDVLTTDRKMGRIYIEADVEPIRN